MKEEPVKTEKITLTNADIKELIEKISKIDNNITISEITSINKDKTVEENKTFYSIHYEANNNGKKIKKRLNIEIDRSEYDIFKDYKIYFLIFFFIALTITISSLFPFSNIVLSILPSSISMAISFVKYCLPLIIQYYTDNMTIEQRIDIDMKDNENLEKFVPEKFLSLLAQENNIKNGKLKLEIENLHEIEFKNETKKNIIATSFTILALCDVVSNHIALVPIALWYNLHYRYIPSYLEATKKIDDKYKDYLEATKKIDEKYQNQKNTNEEIKNNIKTNRNTQNLENAFKRNLKRKKNAFKRNLKRKKTIATLITRNNLKDTSIKLE